MRWERKGKSEPKSEVSSDRIRGLLLYRGNVMHATRSRFSDRFSICSFVLCVLFLCMHLCGTVVFFFLDDWSIGEFFSHGAGAGT